MTKTKSTKRALLSSALALVLCVSMLVGSTFAWFTDSVTSGSNVIQAGNLDIVLEYWNGTEWADAKGVKLEFLKASTDAGNEVLWEPGCTYELPKIRVRNEGNLSAYVVLSINGVTGDEKLLEAIEFKTKVNNIPASMLTGSQSGFYSTLEGKEFVPFYGTPDGTVLFDWPLAAKGVITPNSGNTDTSPEFTVYGHMDEEAGNEYQNLTIKNVSITAVATQLVYEYDSFGRDYDENAELPASGIYVDDASGAYDVFSGYDQSGQSATINLNADYKTSDAYDHWSSNREYAIRRNTKTLIGTDLFLNLNGHSIDHDGTYQDGKNTGYTYLFTTAYDGKLTVNGEGSIRSQNAEGFTCIFYAQGPSEIVINGGDYHAVAGVPVWAGNGAKVTINGGSFTSSGSSNEELIYSSGGIIDIYGGFFHNTEWESRPVNVANANRGTGYINIYGGTFVNFDPSTGGDDPNNIKVADGYTVVSETQANGDVWYTVVAE